MTNQANKILAMFNNNNSFNEIAKAVNIHLDDVMFTIKQMTIFGLIKPEELTNG
jgi:predicted transcriptional regulator